MSIHYLISAFIVSFCLSTLTIAGEIDTSPKGIDYPYSNEEFSLCGMKKSAKEMMAAAEKTPTETTEINYVSGGICAEEVNFMKGIAKHFPLEIVLVQQEGGHEVYLADVNVSLQTAKQEEVLNVVTEGPFLFVNLPDGKYTIHATFHGIEQTRSVRITQKKHSRVVFLWREETTPNPID